jgi:hypothetical protein
MYYSFRQHYYFKNNFSFLSMRGQIVYTTKNYLLFLKTESSGFCTINRSVFDAKIYHKIEKTWERYQADKRKNTSKIRFQSGT